MKLYVKSNTGKIYLSLNANTKQELASKLGNQVFNFGGSEKFHVNQVEAEMDSAINGGVGAIIGGVVGALGGPAGVLIGASLGGIFGSSKNDNEKSNVDNFNRSRV
ncbi:MAG: hypothetical protein Q8K92_06335 [Leadbetterella sp.]|nr:hypothetical protein [Leadbetterella sp.]